jgi:hypothetical protein
VRKFIRFFITGPGVVLVVVGIAITVAWIIKQGQDKQRAEAEKHQVQRPLGQVKPSENVDGSQASKESVLSNRRLSPGFNTAAQTLPITSVRHPRRGAPRPFQLSLLSTRKWPRPPPLLRHLRQRGGSPNIGSRHRCSSLAPSSTLSKARTSIRR